MKLSAPPPPPPPPSDGTPGASSPGAPDEQPTPAPAAPAAPPPAGEAAAPKPAVWPAWYSGVDAALVGLVVVFAFAAASFVARNSDVWVHLAAGKRLFAGEYVPGGSDPFSYSAEGRAWVNHSWLTDAVAYLLYGAGGAALVAVKAALVALTFGLLIAIRRPRFALWPWAALACVGVLAAAPQFVLRPLIVSMLLFAVTLVLLFRVPHKPGSWRFPIAVGVTFWIWANADQWFFVGPLALALLLFGELIQKYGFNTPDEPTDTPDTEPLGRLPDIATLAKALGVGLLACTLTPHHVRVWELPFELTGAPGIDTDPRLRVAHLAPHINVYITDPGLGYNANGLAYAVLFVAGATIFGLGVGRVRVAHVALWLGFAVLSLFSVYAIPFFVLVAVPMVAAQLNAHSARAELKTWGNPRTRLLLLGSSVGRLLSVVAVCALCVLAYPGWVHPDVSNPVYARRVAWGVEPDPALVRGAERLGAWRQSGALPADARGFITNIELANYAAWYAPQEKVFVNGRYGHHRRELADYVTVRQGLGLVRVPNEAPDPAGTDAVLQKAGAEYVTVDDNVATQPPALSPVERLYRNWGRWSAWYTDGRTAMFGWRPENAPAKPTFAALRLDAAAAAFGPEVTKGPDPELKPPLAPLGWEGAFVRAPKAAPTGAAEAIGWLEYKEALVARLQLRQALTATLFFYAPPVQDTFHQVVMATADARGLLRFPAGGATPEVAEALRVEAEALRAVPLLALRAARRGIADDPDHPDAYFALGRALADPNLPLTESERALGTVTAYSQCLARLPKPEQYRRGEFAVTGADVALRLAQAYLGSRISLRDPRGKEVFEYTGFPCALAPLSALFGQPLYEERNGSISRGQPRGPDAVPFNNGTPYVLPIDLARKALGLAREYAPLDVAGKPEEQQKAAVKQIEEFHKEIENVVIRYKDRFPTAQGAAVKMPALVNRAAASGMFDEALKLMGATENAVQEGYGPDYFGGMVLMIGLELAAGRIEDADAHLALLSSPQGTAEMEKAQAVARQRVVALQTGQLKLTEDEQRLALLQVNLIDHVRQLKYQKAVLACEYKLAGDLWEGLTSGIGQFDALPPPGPTVPAPLLLGALQTVNGIRDPERTLHAMLAPPLVATPGHAQMIQTYLWFASWDGLRRSTQQMLGRQLSAEANFFSRRGVLFLLEGNVPAAKERFKDALRKPPAGWELPNVTSSDADRYLKLIESAEKRAGR